MIKQGYILTILASVMLTGCMSSVINSPALLDSQKAYEAIKQDKVLNQYAALSLFQAGKLYNLSKAAKTDAEANHFAYLLKQEIAVAKESARAKQLLEKMNGLRKHKRQALLDKKEDEIRRAQEDARRAQEESLSLEKKYVDLQELNAKMTSRGLVLTLGDVLFESNRENLMPGALRALDKLKAFLMENEARQVLIEGHTDNVESSIYNIDLSLRRAEAVSKVLVAKGIVESRITIKGYGEKFPVVANSDDAAREQNRRVEIVILNEGEEVENVAR